MQGHGGSCRNLSCYWLQPNHLSRQHWIGRRCCVRINALPTADCVHPGPETSANGSRCEACAKSMDWRGTRILMWLLVMDSLEKMVYSIVRKGGDGRRSGVHQPAFRPITQAHCHWQADDLTKGPVRPRKPVNGSRPIKQLLSQPYYI